MMRIRLLSLLLVAAMALQIFASLTAHPSRASAESSGPVVTAISPTTGTPITPDRPIRLTFDEPVRIGAGNVILDPASADANNIVYPVSDSTHVQWETTQQVLIKPNGLTNGETYTVTVEANAFKGVISDKFSAPLSVGTYTVRDLDVSSVFPDYDETAVDADHALTLQIEFNQSGMKAGSGNIYVKKISNNAVVQTISVTASNAVQFVDSTSGSVTKTTARIPIARLANSTGYYILIDPGAFLDEYNNPYAGILNPLTWTFTTEDLFDTVPPVATFTPAKGGTMGQTNGNLVLAFNENVYKGNGNISIMNADNSLFCAIPVTSSTAVTITGGKTVTVSPSAFSCPSFIGGATYKVLIGTGVILDGTGNSFEGTVASPGTPWSFTVVVDSTPPAPSAYTPSAGATGVSVATKTFSLTFNEPVKTVSTSAYLFPQTVSPPASPNLTMSVDGTDNRKINLVYAGADLSPSTTYAINIPAGAITDLANNAFAGILNVYAWTFATGQSGGIPALNNSTMEGSSTIVLTYSETLNSANVPYPDNYFVTVNGVIRSVSSVSVSGTQVRLALSSGVLVGQVVKLAYTPDLYQSSRHVQSLLAKEATAFSNRDVTNTADTTRPQPVSGVVTGQIVSVTFSKALASLGTYAYSQFVVNWGGQNITPTSATLSGTTVFLSLPSVSTTTGAVSVSYYPGSYPLADTSGNAVTAFSSFAVMNPADSTAPVFSSAIAGGNKIILTYNEPLRTTPLPSLSGFSVLVNGASASLSSVGISGSTVELTLAQSLTSGQAVVLSYVPTNPPVADTTGNLAASISNYAMVAGTSAATRLAVAVVNGSTLMLSYNAALNNASAYTPYPSQYIVKVDNTVVGVGNVAISGSQVTLTLQTPVTAGNLVRVSYFTSPIPVRDTLGQAVDPLSEMAVTNQTSGTVTNLPDYLTSAAGGGVALVPGKTTTTSSAQTTSGAFANKYQVDSAKLASAFAALKQGGVSQPVVSIQVPTTEGGAIVSLPVQSLLNAASSVSNGQFQVDYGTASFKLPLKAVNYASQLQGTGYGTSTAQLVVRIEKSTNPALPAAITKQGGKLLGSAYDFSLSLAPDLGMAEKSVSELDAYVERSLTVDASGLSRGDLAVMRLETATGEASFVPTTTEQSGSMVKVNFLRKGNSVYAVMYRQPIVFSDMTKHWAKNDVSRLAAKLIVKGSTATLFKPDQAITRADFSEYVARGLGLTGDRNSATKFKDVDASRPNAVFIGAAVKAGIIFGDTTGKFRPNAPITREEMATILVRAMKYAGYSATAASNALNQFGDKSKVSAWAKDGVSICVQAGIISGVTTKALKPAGNATRAQAASMIRRFLSYVELIDA